MARTRFGKTFRTRRGRYGRYKYVNGRRVSFVPTRKFTKRGRSYYRGFKRSSRSFRRY